MAKPEQRDGDESFPAYQPTPTQRENDLAAVGETPLVKVPDGSDRVPPLDGPDERAVKAALVLYALSITPNPPQNGGRR